MTTEDKLKIVVRSHRSRLDFYMISTGIKLADVQVARRDLAEARRKLARFRRLRRERRAHLSS